MLRSMICVSLFFASSTAMAVSARGTRLQRRVMIDAVERLSPSVSRSELRPLLDAELAMVTSVTRNERRMQIEQTAQSVARSADEVIRGARANDPDETRRALKDLLRGLMRAALLQNTPSREEVGVVSVDMLGVGIIAGVSLGLGTVLLGIPFESFGLLEAGGALALGSTLGLFPLDFYEDQSEKLRLPGAVRLAPKLRRLELDADFWGSVRRLANEYEPQSAEDLGSRIATELKNVTLAQACVSALLTTSVESEGPTPAI